MGNFFFLRKIVSAGVTFLKMKIKNGAAYTGGVGFLRCAVCFLNLLLGGLCGGRPVGGAHGGVGREFLCGYRLTRNFFWA